MNKNVKHVEFQATDPDRNTVILRARILGNEDLEDYEFARLVRSLKRQVARALEQVAETNFGIDNIEIRNKRWTAGV